MSPSVDLQLSHDRQGNRLYIPAAASKRLLGADALPPDSIDFVAPFQQRPDTLRCTKDPRYPNSHAMRLSGASGLRSTLQVQCFCCCCAALLTCSYDTLPAQASCSEVVLCKAQQLLMPKECCFRCHSYTILLQLDAGCWIRLAYDKAAGRMHIAKPGSQAPNAEAATAVAAEAGSTGHGSRPAAAQATAVRQLRKRKQNTVAAATASDLHSSPAARALPTGSAAAMHMSASEVCMSVPVSLAGSKLASQWGEGCLTDSKAHCATCLTPLNTHMVVFHIHQILHTSC